MLVAQGLMHWTKEESPEYRYDTVGLSSDMIPRLDSQVAPQHTATVLGRTGSLRSHPLSPRCRIAHQNNSKLCLSRPHSNIATKKEDSSIMYRYLWKVPVRNPAMTFVLPMADDSQGSGPGMLAQPYSIISVPVCLVSHFLLKVRHSLWP